MWRMINLECLDDMQNVIKNIESHIKLTGHSTLFHICVTFESVYSCWNEQEWDLFVDSQVFKFFDFYQEVLGMFSESNKNDVN